MLCIVTWQENKTICPKRCWTLPYFLNPTASRPLIFRETIKSAIVAVSTLVVAIWDEAKYHFVCTEKSILTSNWKPKHALSVTSLEWDGQPPPPSFPPRKCSFCVVWLVSSDYWFTPWLYLDISAFSPCFISFWVERPGWHVYFSNKVLIWSRLKSPYGDSNANEKAYEPLDLAPSTGSDVKASVLYWATQTSLIVTQRII